MRSSIIICVAAIFLSLVNILAATPNLPVDSYAFVDKKNAKLNKKRPSKPLRSRPVKKAVSRHKYNYKPKKTVANAPAKSNIKNPNARPSRNKLSGKPYGNKRVSKNPNTSRGKDWAKSGYSSNKTHKLKNKSELINSAVKGGLNLVTPIGTLGLNDLGASKDNNDDDDDDYDDFISGHGDNSSHKSSGKIAGLAANGWSSGKRSNDHAARGPKSDLEDDYTNDEGDDDTKSDLEDDYTNDEGDDYDTKSDLEDDYTNDEGDYDTKSDLEDDYTNDEGDYDTKSDLEDDYTNDEGDGDSVQENGMQRPKVKAYVSNLKYVDGLEYLGAGYDVIKGNPLGSSDSLLDPGYRYPVITQKSANCPRNNSNCITVNSLLSIPMGVWVRRLSSCAKQERVRSLTQSNNTLDTKNIKNDLKFDVSIESPSPNDEHAFTAAFSFASSFSYDNLMKIATSRGHSIQQNMVYCYKYVTGYSLPVDKLSYSSEFAKFVKSLPVDFFAADCVASFYKTYPKSDNCKSVNSWMTLFNIFGTHFVTLVFLGGKIIINDTINTQQDIQNVKRNAQLNIDLNAKALDLSLDVGTSLSKNSNYTTSGATKSIYFLGGSVASPLDNFSAWSDSLSEHAMPVRITLQPLHLILPAQLTDSYNSAYQYYATLAPD